MSNSKYIPVLRVTQLDTNELDQSILLTLKQSLNQDIFKYIQHNFFQKYNTEIFAVIKCILWHFTFNKRSQTIGQSLLSWSYLEKKKINVIKKIIHCLIFCFDEFFIEKFPILIRKFLDNLGRKRQNQESENEALLNRKVEKIVNFFSTLFRSVSFLHYLQFLFDGRYLRLWERILGLQPSYMQEQYLKSYSHEISEREELWQTYFSLFKLIDSLINFNKMYSKVSKFRAKNSTLHDEFSIKICALCDNSPSMAHQSADYDNLDSCKHVFCYLCIKKALMDNQNKFECPVKLKSID
ncbi:peroxisome biogenesis factor 2 [Brachionus plicatilis]|uniref:RING-type E3 ubiquitin transferase (cysteine targeting) n=1 Tax=Brachionus plicatilis TaxID=10195 RepID=A0A3M7REN6_BRAPC|nr:peroxisome biogenesis factor 2 [Brachionus plicatilis]